MTYATTPGPIVPQPIRPRTIWYWIAGLVGVLAVAGAVVWGITGFRDLDDTIDSFARVPTPDGGTITIEDPGGYVLYAEPSSAPAVPVRSIAIAGPDGEPVRVEDYGGVLTYDFGGRAGVAVGTFDAATPGDYRIRVDPTTLSTTRTIAVGPSIAGDLVWTIVGAILIAGVGIVLAIVIAVVTAIRRSRARRRQTPPAPAGWAPASTWQPPTPAPQQPPPPPGGAPWPGASS